ncbi:hypothetical protein [Clostridium sp. ZS2-4]|uniref:hypothetical protein n=1 Tax=Clostridium sp. ZS2-4 TaxID=2987703 RepID=UPI00227C0B45|nr:hypothetical protein [Clostridium sp. ZS2-4]MCY6354834.1 hypothetical protein [Clostridium sp. ZS2-4]
MVEKKIDASNYLALGLYAFAGFGLEILLLMVEVTLFEKISSKWSVFQHCFHWTITCVMWGIVVLGLVSYSKKKYDFDIFSFRDVLNCKQWIRAVLIVIVAIIVISVVNGGIKPVTEFKNLAGVKFTFQNIYYLFESMLIMLTVVFGQKYGEILSKRNNIPWGGIFLALTWGLVHIFTQNLVTGIFTFIISIVFGIVYLVDNKNIRYAYPMIALIFIL